MRGSLSKGWAGVALARTVVGVLAGALFVAWAVPALAQSYPQKTVRFISSAVAGTPVDVATRMMAAALGDAWKEPVIVEDRPGGNLVVATQAVVRAAPDGYTLLATQGAMAQNPALHAKDLPYDTLRDLAPITQLYSLQIIYAVDSRLPATSLQEFLDLVRKNPGKFNFASYGSGTTAELLGIRLNKAANVDITIVNFQGTAPAITAVIGGQVASTMADWGAMAAQVNAGKLRPIATTGRKRFSFAPNVPTFEESGISGFGVMNWAGWFAPAGTPDAILNKIVDDTRRIAAQPEMAARFNALMVEPWIDSPAEARENIKNEIAYWKNLVETSGMKLQ